MPLKIYFEDQPLILEEHDPLITDYTRIKAAGGLVVSDSGKVLMIFRRGKWDLPKGKFEEGETIEECAEREVMEETGLTTLGLKRPLMISYHTYQDGKQEYLKETHWFLFNAPGEQPLTPQTEEDITKIEWVRRDDLGTHTSNTYELIRDVLRAGGFM